MENNYIWTINGCEFEIDMEQCHLTGIFPHSKSLRMQMIDMCLISLKKSVHTAGRSVNFMTHFWVKVRPKNFLPE